MGKRRQQVADIRLYCWFIRKCKQHPWLMKTPIKYAERLFFPHHRTVPADKYFAEVMKRLGIQATGSVDDYYDELIGDEHLRQAYFDAGTYADDSDFEQAWRRRFRRVNYVVNYYALIRETRPSIVVETGTAEGDLTSWVLAAMHKNAHGRLLSIDIPPKKDQLTMTTTLEADNVGRLIPAAYRDRWEYHAGDAKVLLPRLLAENDVDIFIHDSLHTRTHMLFEYNCARALMRPGTVIMSHDILWNKAFFAFTASHNLQGLSCVADPNLGFTVNRFDPWEENIGLGVVNVP